MNKEPITVDGYEKLVNEIKYYREVEIPYIIEDIKISASYGDLTENAEYEAATERQGFLLTRVNELEQLLSKLVIINPSESNHNRITFGSTFEIIDIDTEEMFVYTLVGGYEAEPSKGTISYNSPLAKAFIGKEKEDEVKVNLNGNEVYYEIKNIYFDKELFKKK
jgi:transcription elongation factor GreA